MSSPRESLELVMGMIGCFEADGIFEAIDDEAALDQCREIREDLQRLAVQCEGLCELMPHNADKYRFQLGEEERAIEARVAKLMMCYPWKYLAQHAGSFSPDSCVVSQKIIT